MAFEKKVPEWLAEGIEPPASLKESGFAVGYKPPADYFNWFWHGVSEAIKELQGATPRDIGAIAEEATYYSSVTEVDIDTATHSLLLVDKKWAKDCPLCKNNAFVFIMQLFFGDPTASTSRTQIAFSYGDGGENDPKGIALRCYFGGVWSGWTELYGPHNKPTCSDVGAAPTEHNHSASEINSGTLDAARLPITPVTKGGTGSDGWHQALTNLKAMGRLSMYYSSTSKPDIDTLTDSLMLIPIEYSKECPVGGGFVYIMQVFYGDITAESNRTQIAFPYLVDGSIGRGMATRSYYNGTWSEWDELASTSEHQIKTYNSLAEIGLTAGSETIEGIATKLGAWSELLCATGAGNANIYPDIYGMLRVTSVDSSRVRFQWISKSVNIEYVGVYSFSNSTPWTGWQKVYNAQYPPTPSEISAAPMDYAKQVGAPRNLLDNSYFLKPVNQRGQENYDYVAQYTIDRWKKPTNLHVSVEDPEEGVDLYCSAEAGGLNGFTQVPEITPAAGAVVTLAVMEWGGAIRCGSVKWPNSGYVTAFTTEIGVVGRVYPDRISIMLPPDANIFLHWAALYEGEYTAETLPPYHPKEHATELLECKRYYYRMSTVGLMGYSYSATTAYAILELPNELRTNGTLTISDDTTITIRTNNLKVAVPVANVSVFARNRTQYRLKLDITGLGIPADTSLIVMMSGSIEVSADL